MPELPLLQVVRQYLRTILDYWWAFAPGVVMPLPDIYKWLHPRHKELEIPHWVRVGSLIAALFLAQFLAYRNSAKNLVAVMEEKRQFSMKVNELNAQLRDDEQKIDQLKGEIPQVAVRESKGSLRRRTVHLADELEAFLNERVIGRQQLITQLPSGTPEQDSARERKLREFDIETQNLYVTRGLKEKTGQIVRELKAKGIKVGMVEYLAQNAVYSGFEIEHMRDLAYRLDANDNLVRF